MHRNCGFLSTSPSFTIAGCTAHKAVTRAEKRLMLSWMNFRLCCLRLNFFCVNYLPAPWLKRSYTCHRLRLSFPANEACSLLSFRIRYGNGVSSCFIIARCKSDFNKYGKLMRAQEITLFGIPENKWSFIKFDGYDKLRGGWARIFENWMKYT